MSINNKEVTLYKNKVEKSIGTAIFSLDHKYRYVLTRKWSDNGICLFIMLNPSTADAYKLDPTVKRAFKIAKRFRLGELVVLNIFAIKGSDPSVIKEHTDPVGKYNDYYLNYYCKKSKMIIVAWGNHGSYNNRSNDVKNILLRNKKEVYCIDINISGEPKHPLYTRNNSKLKKYKLDK